MAVNTKATSAGAYLRTYDNPKYPKEYADWAIWEAARATSAAPTYFEPLKRGDQSYVDGGLGFNNPVAEWANILLFFMIASSNVGKRLIRESIQTFDKLRPIGSLITIGTGIAPHIDLSVPNLWGTVNFLTSGIVSIATSCERNHISMAPIIDALPAHELPKYVRILNLTWCHSLLICFASIVSMSERKCTRKSGLGQNCQES